MQLFEIFEYLSTIHNAVFGNCNGNYRLQKRDKLNARKSKTMPILEFISFIIGY